MRVLKSEETAVHLVTLLEEMPVQETVDGVAELRATGLPVGRVVVNMVRRQVPGVAPDQLAAAADRAQRRFSWSRVGAMTLDAYADLLGRTSFGLGGAGFIDLTDRVGRGEDAGIAAGVLPSHGALPSSGREVSS